MVHFETLFALLMMVSIATILLSVWTRLRRIQFKAGLKPKSIRRFVLVLNVLAYTILATSIFFAGLAAILLPGSVPVFGAWSFFAGISILLGSMFIYLILFAARARRSVPLEDSAQVS